MLISNNFTPQIIFSMALGFKLRSVIAEMLKIRPTPFPIQIDLPPDFRTRSRTEATRAASSTTTSSNTINFWQKKEMFRLKLDSASSIIKVEEESRLVLINV